MKSWLLSRRQVLRGAAGAIISLPLLEGMARADVPRKRFVSLTVPHGTVPDLWFPTGTEKSFQYGPILSALDAYKNDLIALEGVDNKTNGNGAHHASMITYLTGRNITYTADPNSDTAGGISVDQEMAKGMQTPFSSLQLGTREQLANQQSVSYSGTGGLLPRIGTAKGLFDKLFAINSPEAKAKLARRMSILNGAMEDFNALKRRLGKADIRRVDAHMSSISELEKRFQATSNCGPGALVPGTTASDIKGLPQMMSEMIEVIVLALACDLTRVVTYTARQEGAYSGFTFEWLGMGQGVDDAEGIDPRPDDTSETHHSMSHYDTTPENRDKLKRVGQWYASQFALLIKRLKETPDGAGTLFDSTIALYGSSLGQGNHSANNLPLVLTGGGSFRPGRYLKYQSASHTALLLSLLQAMGSPATSFGEPSLASGPLPGLV